MRVKITNQFISTLQPGTKPFEVRDTIIQGLILRVQPSGSMSYICEYGRGKRLTLGKITLISPNEARDEAKLILADVLKGVDPKAERKPKKSPTFYEFLDDVYLPWISVNRKRGDAEVARLKSIFSEFKNKKLSDITSWQVEKWRARRLRMGRSKSTVNRDLAPLKAAFSRAEEWCFISGNPLVKTHLCKVDSNKIVRYLSKIENKSLRNALHQRDIEIRSKRASANIWRVDRRFKKLPGYQDMDFVDHLEPMIILSLNLGLRRGELFQLEWSDINYDENNVAIRAEKTKSQKSRHIPLNTEALDIFKKWEKQSKKKNNLIFPNSYGVQFNNVNKAWKSILEKAGIEKFRWHDLRHTFASNLIMAGVDINTVREFLGHADLKMTLRYAHLAPEHKAEAVEKLIAS